MKHASHTLFEGHVSDPSGRNESWIETVQYLGGSRWLLACEGTDFSGLHAGERFAERIGTTKLIRGVLERDSEDGEGLSASKAGDENDNDESQPAMELGLRGKRLLEIATSVGATLCVRRLRQWKAGDWPREPRPPRIMAITGAAKRGIWKGIWHPVYTVETTQGSAFLYSPMADGTARLVLKSSGSFASGWTIRVPNGTLIALEPFKPILAQLELDKRA